MKRHFCVRRKLLQLSFITFIAIHILLLASNNAPNSQIDPKDIAVEKIIVHAADKGNQYSAFRKGDISWLKKPEDFFRRLETEKQQTHCKRLVQMGGTSCNRVPDGNKLVCLDPDVYLDPKGCVIYSFGVSIEISFDNAAATYGCTVYMMDPTLPPGAYSHLRDKQKFFPLGLGDSNNIQKLNLTTYADWEGEISMKIATFDDIHKLVGYDGPVHYLKMDIEGSEWNVFQYMMDYNLLKNVQQIAVEIHEVSFSGMELSRALNHLQQRWLTIERLEDHGFLRVNYEPTLSIQAIYKIPGSQKTLQMCGELFLIRRNRTQSS